MFTPTIVAPLGSDHQGWPAARLPRSPAYIETGEALGKLVLGLGEAKERRAHLLK